MEEIKFDSSKNLHINAEPFNATAASDRNWETDFRDSIADASKDWREKQKQQKQTGDKKAAVAKKDFPKNEWGDYAAAGRTWYDRTFNEDSKAAWGAAMKDVGMEALGKLNDAAKDILGFKGDWSDSSAWTSWGANAINGLLGGQGSGNGLGSVVFGTGDTQDTITTIDLRHLPEKYHTGSVGEGGQDGYLANTIKKGKPRDADDVMPVEEISYPSESIEPKKYLEDREAEKKANGEQFANTVITTKTPEEGGKETDFLKRGSAFDSNEKKFLTLQSQIAHVISSLDLQMHYYLAYFTLGDDIYIDEHGTCLFYIDKITMGKMLPSETIKGAYGHTNFATRAQGAIKGDSKVSFEIREDTFMVFRDLLYSFMGVRKEKGIIGNYANYYQEEGKLLNLNVIVPMEQIVPAGDTPEFEVMHFTSKSLKVIKLPGIDFEHTMADNKPVKVECTCLRTELTFEKV